MDAREKKADRHRRLIFWLLLLGSLEYSLTDTFLQGGPRLLIHSLILFAIAVMAGELTWLNIFNPYLNKMVEKRVQQRLRGEEEEKEKDEERDEEEGKL